MKKKWGKRNSKFGKKLVGSLLATLLVLSAGTPSFSSSASPNSNGIGKGLSKDNGKKWSIIESGEINYATNRGGPTLGYSDHSGVDIIIRAGYAFKDLNKNKKLDQYEDWRLSIEERAEDLASKMSVEQISGLMLYSSHQRIDSAELTESQRSYIVNDNLRHVLFTSVASPETAAQWNNNAQALAEGLGLGIPLNNSSDPRHGSDSSAEFNAGAGGDISMWPESIGLAATFDPKIVEEFGEIASKEYRALGISTALSPQIDIATDPRWYRFPGTFGEDAHLSADMARAYADGFQTSSGEDEITKAWGYTSVNTMAKHWPGGGSGEAGRDAHYPFGKYAVYPGNNFEEHLIPFLNGVFDLKGGTGSVSAIMPYYTISWDQDTKYGENVGNSYSKYMINDLLRNKYGYNGVITTDWGITEDIGYEIDDMEKFGYGTSWGVEDLSVPERFYKVIMNGVDQFGGVDESDDILVAYQMGVEEHGEEFIRNRFEESAVRLLKNVFQVGLFENPYLDVKETAETVGNPEFMEAGFEAQLKSIVMLKNKDKTLPLKAKDNKKLTAYVPERWYPPVKARFGGGVTPGYYEVPFNLDVVQKYFNVTKDPNKADFALVGIKSPDGGLGYSVEDRKNGGNGYLPISLQYGEYTADHARKVSIAGGHPTEDFTNRSYKGKTVTAANTKDLDLVLETREKMGDKPVIVSINMSTPAVLAEFENKVDAILVNFGVQDQALFEVLSGGFEPSGLLPLQMPASMKTVEEQFEDVPHDMDVHVDSEGNAYDFTFGLNWDGVISDERVKKYRK
ncbi:glycoside hydrolase family 3 N-terminal domain-containing protein [Alkalihalobacillus sp. TS-13]|uniref:glycoside hydrolase family 3 protein n=1 Tax=Alkalihalobacillus sp. TS-13 TaxID=2842455 RepID=UPI001C87023B|nr:glycoside hydrolase family 3 N-terminal domain-containing protein [Alkalihalobacillus sp. TS-13]